MWQHREIDHSTGENSAMNHSATENSQMGHRAGIDISEMHHSAAGVTCCNLPAAARGDRAPRCPSSSVARAAGWPMARPLGWLSWLAASGRRSPGILRHPLPPPCETSNFWNTAETNILPVQASKVSCLGLVIRDGLLLFDFISIIVEYSYSYFGTREP